jgi:putative peptidoglycan lipid II flippase
MDDPGDPERPAEPPLTGSPDRADERDLVAEAEAMEGAAPDASVDPTQTTPPRQGELMAKGAGMAVGTIVSRITGLLRDMAMTAALGLGIVADLFTVGNTIPNTVYVLTVGGAMNAVFVPQLVRRMRDDSDGGAGFADRLLTLTAVVLTALTVVAILLAPLLTRIYASPQYTAEQLELATMFARYCLPQVFFYGLFTLLSQVLNARGRFNPPMYAPIVNNVLAIGVFVSFLVVAGPAAVSGGTLSGRQVAWLGLGSTVAVAGQALILIPYVRASGYRWRARFDWRGWGLGKTGGLALWTLGLLAANQVSFIVHSRLATTANVLAGQEGTTEAGIATYQKAYLIFFLPHSIVTVSLVTALLPGLSRVAHARQFDVVGRLLSDTTRTVTALVVPITAVLLPLSPLLAAVLFGYGASGRDAAFQVGFTTIGMLAGLVPFSIYFILLRGWYSLEDTKTPFYLSLVLNAINVALSIGLFVAAPTNLKVPAIGLATGLTYWLMMPIAWPLLKRRVGDLHTRATWRAVLRMLVAGILTSAVTAAVLAGLVVGWDGLWDAMYKRVAALVLASAVGLVAYLALARLLRIREVSDAIATVRRRVGH